MKYMLFSQIFERKLPIEEIVSYTKRLKRDSSLLILSRLSYSNYNAQSVLQRFQKQLILHEEDRYVRNYSVNITDSVLITKQGTLNAIKYVLKFVVDNKEKISDKRDEEFYDITRLILALQDHLTDILKLLSQTFSLIFLEICFLIERYM